jgi:hypothetical protein
VKLQHSWREVRVVCEKRVKIVGITVAAGVCSDVINFRLEQLIIMWFLLLGASKAGTVTCLCAWMLGGFAGREVSEEEGGYRLAPSSTVV